MSYFEFYEFDLQHCCLGLKEEGEKKSLVYAFFLLKGGRYYESTSDLWLQSEMTMMQTQTGYTLRSATAMDSSSDVKELMCNINLHVVAPV